MRAKFRIKKDGWWLLRDILENDQEFNTDQQSLRGRKISHPTEISIGRLDFDLRNVSGVDYVIYSYATPIAWRRDGVWSVDDTRYSVTTSCHQGRVLTAVSNMRKAWERAA